LDVLFLAFTVTMILPKLQKLQADGWIQTDSSVEPAMSRMFAFLKWIVWACSEPLWCALAVALGWGLFEWRVRGDHKPFMRLSALGSGAVGLTLAVILTGACVMVVVMLGLPGTRIARPWAVETVASIDTSVAALEQALAKKDWDAVQEQAGRA